MKAIAMPVMRDRGAEGETHFRLTIVSTAFAGKSRIERHRLVHDVLAEELKDRVHALTLTARTPEETQAR